MINGLSNGEIRFLKLPDSTDSDPNGFYSEERTARTTDFLPCTWQQKTAEEAKIAERTQSDFVYVIVIAQYFENSAVEVNPSDRAELRIKKGGDAVTLEIIGVINQSNITHKIIAVLTDAAN